MNQITVELLSLQLHRDASKVMNVVDSCKIYQHIIAVMRMRDLFLQKWNHKIFQIEDEFRMKLLLILQSLSSAIESNIKKRISSL